MLSISYSRLDFFFTITDNLHVPCYCRIIVICFFVVAVVVLILALIATRKHQKSQMLSQMKSKFLTATTRCQYKVINMYF